MCSACEAIGIYIEEPKAPPAGTSELAGIAPPQPGTSQNPTDTVPGSTATTFGVSVGGSVTGWINGSGDRDWYSITLTAGQTYTFNLDGSGTTVLADPYLYLYNSAGSLLTQNDDGGPGTNSQITFTATSSGTYYLGAGAYGDGYTGQYTLSAAAGGATLPTYTLDQIASQLTDGYWNSTGRVGRKFVDADNVITYNVTGLTAGAAVLADLAFQMWADVSGLSFQKVTTSAQITLDDASSGAFASSSTSGNTILSSTVNVGADWLAAYGTSMYSYTFQTYIHEIGHALGLGHAGNYNGGATYGTNNHYANDSWAYSIMSYFDQAESGYGSFRFVMAPQMGDIVAIQNLYGADAATRAGDTTYGHNSNAGTVFSFSSYTNAPAFTIYDASGTDTLDASGYSNTQTINLSAETFSSIGGYSNNISIARGVTIENASGGSGIDTINGNGVANTLNGNNGADVLSGNGGNDTLNGGAGADQLFGGEGNDTIYYDGGDNLANVLGGNGTDTLLFTSGSAPTSFGLAAHEFEGAEGRLTDTSGQWWSQVTEYYNASWQLTNKDTLADDGRTIATTYDVSAGGTGINWQYVSDYRNAGGTLTNQDGLFDNGGTFAKAFDYAAGTATDGVDDWLREYTYFFRSAADQAAGNVLNVEGFADDGRKFTQTNDIDGNQAWTFQTNWYENDGVTLDYLEVRWDNGSTQIIPY